MGEATRDKQSSSTESKNDVQKRQGWIRLHTDEGAKSPSVDKVDEPEDSVAQSHDRKVRKLEKPIE